MTTPTENGPALPPASRPASNIRRFSCLLCGCPTADTVIDSAPDRLHGVDRLFTYVRCTDCEVLQLEHIPADLWSTHYAGYGRHAAESALYALGRRLITGRCYPTPDGPGRLLDIGCGNGWYLKMMSGRGWDPVGFEPDEGQAAEVTQRTGIPVVSNYGDLEPNSFDLVTLNFSLEHVNDPASVITQVARVLKPGGQVTISLPDPEGREARIFGKFWFHLDSPRHLVLLSRRQLDRLLTQHGFDVQDVRSLPTATGFAGSVSYRLLGRFSPALWYSAAPLGMVFSLLVRDGLFLTRATKRSPPTTNR